MRSGALRTEKKLDMAIINCIKEVRVFNPQ